MLNRLNMFKTAMVYWALFAAQSVHAAADHWQMNLHKGVTPISRDIYDLHMTAIYVCAVIGVLVFGVMIYSLIHHRKSKGYIAATFHDNLRLEIVWSIIPFLILVALAIPATTVLFRLEDSRDSDITIKVVASQWKWQYQYLDQGISFYSNLSTPYAQIQNEVPKGQWYLLEVDQPLVVPIKKKIRFIVTATDVVHSWWVPELGIKRDAVPGFMRESWAWIEKPGVYRGQCAELCGINHGFMPIVVHAVKEEEFNQWVSAQTKVEDKFSATAAIPALQPTLTRDELMQRGQAKYNLVCSACHKSDGTGIPPLYPSLKRSSVAVGYPVSRHIAMVLNGVPGTAMQPYKNQLSDEDIAAIVTYERNAWENNTNDLIQPQDVAKERLADATKPTMVKKAQTGGLR
jgi:cytochrome c oxidase subunit II